MMEEVSIAIPGAVAAELQREATGRGLLVAELAGLILHAALLTRGGRDALQVERVNELEQVNHD